MQQDCIINNYNSYLSEPFGYFGYVNMMQLKRQLQSWLLCFFRGLSTITPDPTDPDPYPIL